MTYPNGQSASYAYSSNSGDRRLEEIHQKRSDGSTISKFNYSYDAVGNIKSWTQQLDANPAKAYDFEYDRADQLRTAVWRTTDPTPTILKRYAYTYDPAGNRTVEQIDNAPVLSAYDEMNQLSSQAPGGTMRFAGTLNEAATVMIQSLPATVTSDNEFERGAQVTSGTNQVVVKAKDYAGNERTNTYEVSISGSTKTFSFDANGNMTGDGARTFEWDAENRLIAANQGTLRSEFTYDGRSRRVRIVEKDNGNVISDRRFVWCEMRICEERDANGSVTKRFFPNAMQESGQSYFYTFDHLGSVREMTDTSAALRSRYDYDAYGKRTLTAGDKTSDFGFTGHYTHVQSALVLSPYRAYDPSQGSWISEDPVGRPGHELIKSVFIAPDYADDSPAEAFDQAALSADTPFLTPDGPNLYSYVRNHPVGNVDVTGEWGVIIRPILGCLKSPACRNRLIKPLKKCWNWVKNVRCKPPQIHPPHHTFPWGKRHCHIQLNCWIKGKGGSGVALRVPIPCFK